MSPERVAIVTGAGNGIARATALQLAADGMAVVVNDVDASAVERTVVDIRAAGGRAVPCVVAVGDEAAAERLVSTALDELGGLHVLVNIAGVYAPAPLLKMSAEMFERVVRVHLFGTFFNIKAAVAHMAPQGYGRIVNTTSRAGLRGFPPGECNYSAAKMGIVGLTLALAWELSPQRITVNCVSPVAWTRTAEALPADERAASWQARARNVLGRTGMPEDVAQTYAFLASDRAAYLTGQVVEATGEPMMLL